MRRFLVWLSGVPPGFLAHAPRERARYEGIGGTVLATAVLAAVSMVFVLDAALGVPVPLAVVPGTAWGLAVLSLNRWLGAWMRPGSRRRAVSAVLIQVLIGVAFGMLVATCLMLQVFRPEIEAQAAQIRQQEIEAFREQQASSVEGLELQRLRAEVQALRQVIAAGGDKVRLARARADLAPLQQRLDAAQSRQDALVKWVTARTGDDAGLSIRLRALERATDADATLWIVRWLFLVFFASIEALPVIVRLLTNIRVRDTAKMAGADAQKQLQDSGIEEGALAYVNPVAAAAILRAYLNRLPLDETKRLDLDLLNVGDEPAAAAASRSLAHGLEDLFRLLGPPPDSLGAELQPTGRDDGGRP